MAIKLRSMTEEDYRNLGGRVKTTAGGKSNDSVMADALDSEKLFGIVEGRGVKRSLEYENKRAYIKLERPTINHVLADPVIRSLFQLTGSEFIGICNYTLAYNLDSEDFCKVSELSTGENYVCGGELLKLLIDNFDIEKETVEYIKSIFISKKIVVAAFWELEFGKLSKTEGYPLVGVYKLVLEPGYEAYVKKNYKGKDLTEEFRKVCFSSTLSRLSMLLNLKNKDPLYGLLNFYVAVLPIGMRPKAHLKRNRLTKSYTTIINCNQKLSFVSGSLLPNQFVSMYRDLDKAVNALQYKDMYSKDKKEGPVTVLDKIKSKQGHIRTNNLGKRQDYTGRAVVTVNPYMPLDKVGIPKSLAAKIFKYHALPYLDSATTMATTPKNVDRIIKILELNNIFNDVPCTLGRQPTLHKQSICGFYVEIVEGNAIQVSPLVCEPYNMDFDGDQGWLGVPISDEAIAEVRDLMLHVHNIYYVKSGKCTAVPRMDMIYGLCQCTLDSNDLHDGKSFKFSTLKDVYIAVSNHTISVWDKVSVNGITECAGYAAFRSCFPKPNQLKIQEVTAKTIVTYVDYLLENFSHSQFLISLQKMVELGFKVSKFYSRSVSLLGEDKEIPEYDEAIKIFDDEVSRCEYYYSIGLDDKDTFNLEYSNCIERLNKNLSDHIIDKIGRDSGYVYMAESGARGNKSNLMQMFGYKGKIAASATETIDVTLRNSYSSQLLPIEGAVAAYGGRKGLMDKSLKTADTGYFERQLWHTTQSIVITNADCGTTEGFTIRDIDLAQFFKLEDERRKVMEFFIVGRYEAVTNMYIDSRKAQQIAANRKSITIRSPLKCNNPCCQKCYGRDPGTHKLVAIGSAVGIMASHSIGEPGSQMTMKQFQKGGVASANDVTSGFDRLNDFLNISNLPAKKRNGGVTSYEPIAWCTGETSVVHKGNTKIVSIIGDEKKKKVTVPQEAIISNYVEKGVGIYANKIHGDYYLREIIDTLGIDAAKKYLILQMYTIYKDSVEIVPVHFEVIVSAMSQYMIYTGDREDLRIGQYATKKRLFSGSTEGVIYKEDLVGIKAIHKISIDALVNIMMEDPRLGLARCNILSLTDDLEDLLQRITLSLPIKTGTYYGKEFVNDRRLD